MTAPYNLTFLTNSTDIGALATGVNNQSGGYFFAALLLLSWLLIMFIMRNEDPLDAVLGANFFVSVVGVFMFIAGWVAVWVLTLPVVIFLMAIFVKVWRGAG